jgi:hypothetical protein
LSIKNQFSKHFKIHKMFWDKTGNLSSSAGLSDSAIKYAVAC